MGEMSGAGVGSAPEPKSGNGNGHAPAVSTDAHWCTIHDCAMTRYEKNGRSWYSHRIEGGKWCKGR